MVSPKIAVLVPCYNEALTIGKVVSDFKIFLPDAEIYVYDNNSKDGTSVIAREAGAIVKYEKKQGKANVVFKMFREIDADIYIMIDGDDTYPVDCIQQMLDQFIENNCDMLVGDRLSNNSYKNQNKRAFHNFGNNLVRNLINVFFGSELKDILSGYRIFSKKFVKNYASTIKGFELETDLSIYSLNYELVIDEYSIDYRDRPEGSVSKLNTFTDGFKVIKLFFNLVRLYKPLLFFGTVSAVMFILGLLFMTIPIREYFEYKYVYKVPTLIFSIMLIILSLLAFMTGLILDNISIIDKKNFKVRYNSTR
ncbi:glycosyltransferase family 2 protein [Chryseobacterium polytrichastri]|uniref:Glycosyltransferase, catalytic subunit of cellulose synthase and poly-beta-1,6-N-acetylglucosamine synthase n=1 Tax=Chryseobacterium polytrichastri TaxID=1302687 RepID=A0A1M7JG04_9FLAO|nr:glycosyltransferase family 2 protein [Chryseobacterium polytrichastri]SHM51841.1 Glycosyltransferase, catalytic subunit of cellulose synthase and poly-beta-1,6-N-acetylglucosamine synthase [Chryseobacterium polytrichastri]